MKFHRRTPSFTVAGLLCAASSAVGQTTWYVDADHCPASGSGTQADPYCAIQSAIDAAVSGDAVEVAPGVYTENLDFTLKSITARGRAGALYTIVNAASPSVSAVTFDNGNCLFDGFTVTGGHSPTGGGGIIVLHNNTVVSNCILDGNTADAIGGGFLNFGGEPILINCLLTDNSSFNGGGFHNDHGSSTLINCTLVRNTADADGGGAFVNHTTSFVNCVFWDNADAGGMDESAQVFVSASAVADVTYSCIQGLGTLAGLGNIADDPAFVDALGDDFRLGPGSPAIDAGDSAVVTLDLDLDRHLRLFDDPDTSDTGSGSAPVVDLGAYEFGSGPPPGIPTTSGWGLAAMVLAATVAGTLIFRPRP